MNVFRLPFFLCMLIGCSACSKINCKNGPVDLLFVSFDSTAMGYIHVTVYKGGGTFSDAVSSYYTGYAVLNSIKDSIRFQEAKSTALYSGYDYKVELLSSGKVYFISDIGVKQSHYYNSVGEADDCLNCFYYSINKTHFDKPLQRHPYTTGEYHAFVRIDKGVTY